MVELDGRAADDGPQRIEVRDGFLELHLRAFDGPMRVPLAEVACVAPAIVDRSTMLARPAVVPIAQLQGSTGRPDLVVIFAHPQRVPPVKVQPGGSLHLNRRQSMSSEGLFIDGMHFASAAGSGAVDRLAAAGVPAAADAAPVLEQVVGAAVGGPTIDEERRRVRRRNRALSTASLVGFALAGFAPYVTDSDSAATLLQGIGVLLFVPSTLWILWIMVRQPWKGVRQP